MRLYFCKENAEIIGRRYLVLDLKASSVLFASVAVATIVPVSMALTGIGLPGPPTFGFFNGEDSSIQDPLGDASPVLQRANASIIPQVRSYHDITGAGIQKSNEQYLLSIFLAGDPNLNEKYESNYMWHLISSNPVTGVEQYHVVMLLNFPPDFNHTATGWFYAVFDRTADKYIVPQTGIGKMPADRVEFSLDADHLGNPSSLRYWVSVYTRVDNSDFGGEPEYLMDYAP
jgi:hypothetical protein